MTCLPICLPHVAAASYHNRFRCAVTVACERLSLISPRQQPRLEPFFGRSEFVLLDCERRVDTFRADCRTFTHSSAVPDTLVLREYIRALAGTLVARIQIIAFRQGKRGWSDKVWVEAKNRACRVT